MNVLHGEASRADCYEKHTSTDAATHTLLHFNPTRKMIEPKYFLKYNFEVSFLPMYGIARHALPVFDYVLLYTT